MLSPDGAVSVRGASIAKNVAPSLARMYLHDLIKVFNTNPPHLRSGEAHLT